MTSPSSPQVWRQHKVRELMVKLPDLDGPLGDGWFGVVLPRRCHATAVGRDTWSLPRRFFDDVLDALLARYGEVRITWDTSAQEKCTVQCQKARPETRDDCECVCGSAYHGDPSGGGARWSNVAGDLLVSSNVIRRTWTETREVLPASRRRVRRWEWEGVA